MTLGGETTPDTIAFFPVFLKITNYSLRYMAINDAADLAMVLQTLMTESFFQVGDYQLKAISLLAKIFDAKTQIPNRDVLPTAPSLLIKKISKLPRMEYQTAPSLRVDPDEESNESEQKITSTTKANQPSAATREKYI